MVILNVIMAVFLTILLVHNIFLSISYKNYKEKCHKKHVPREFVGIMLNIMQLSQEVSERANFTVNQKFKAIKIEALTAQAKSYFSKAEALIELGNFDEVKINLIISQNCLKKSLDIIASSGRGES